MNVEDNGLKNVRDDQQNQYSEHSLLLQIVQQNHQLIQQNNQLIIQNDKLVNVLITQADQINELLCLLNEDGDDDSPQYDSIDGH